MTARTYDDTRETLFCMGEPCGDEREALYYIIGWHEDAMTDFQRFCEPLLYDTMIEWSRDDKSTVLDMRDWLETRYIDTLERMTDDELREYLVSHGAVYLPVEEVEE